MNYRLIIIAFFVTLAQPIVAQGILDSIYPEFVRYEELMFNDSAEEELFRADLSEVNVSKGLQALVRTQDHNTQLPQAKWDELISRLKRLKRHKKNEKYIKSIYHEVHSFLLTKYELKATFDQIFSTGIYNCVTASGLYALVFEELGIPYELKQLPSHVYIIAFPAEKILVETTDPNSGFFTINAEFKSEFVNNLAADKLISSEELSTNSTDDLFNEHYFKDQVIDLQKLLGIQYLNQGIYSMQDNRFRNAIEDLEKACYLYPSGACVANLFVAMAKILDESDFKKDRDVMFLARLTRLPKEFELSDSEILGTFAFLTNKLLIESGQKSRYDTIFIQLSNLITENDSLLSQIDLIYNYETSRYFLLAGNEKESLPYAIKALSAEANNLESQAIVIDIFREQFRQQFSKGNMDSTLINEFLELRSNIPELWKNGNYQDLYMHSKGAQISILILNNEFGEALTRLTDLEVMIDETGIAPNQILISNVCGEIAKHFFKRGQYGNARKATTIGLKIYPNDSYLKTIKSQLR